MAQCLLPPLSYVPIFRLCCTIGADLQIEGADTDDPMLMVCSVWGSYFKLALLWSTHYWWAPKTGDVNAAGHLLQEYPLAMCTTHLEEGAAQRL